MFSWNSLVFSRSNGYWQFDLCFLCHKKEHIWVSFNEVDGPRTYYIEWSKSERDREISYFNAYIQKLEKWYWRIHLQGSNGETDWFQIGKGVRQGCVLSPCLFNLYAEYIMRNAGLDEAQAGVKIAGRNINNLRYAQWHHPYGRKWRRTKEPLDESERGFSMSTLQWPS